MCPAAAHPHDVDDDAGTDHLVFDDWKFVMHNKNPKKKIDFLQRLQHDIQEEKLLVAQAVVTYFFNRNASNALCTPLLLSDINVSSLHCTV